MPPFLLWPDFPQSFPHRAHLIRQHDISGEYADNYMYGLNGSPTILRVADSQEGSQVQRNNYLSPVFIISPDKTGHLATKGDGGRYCTVWTGCVHCRQED